MSLWDLGNLHTDSGNYSVLGCRFVSEIGAGPEFAHPSIAEQRPFYIYFFKIGRICGRKRSIVEQRPFLEIACIHWENRIVVGVSSLDDNWTNLCKVWQNFACVWAKFL